MLYLFIHLKKKSLKKKHPEFIPLLPTSPTRNIQCFLILLICHVSPFLLSLVSINPPISILLPALENPVKFILKHALSTPLYGSKAIFDSH